VEANGPVGHSLGRMHLKNRHANARRVIRRSSQHCTGLIEPIAGNPQRPTRFAVDCGRFHNPSHCWWLMNRYFVLFLCSLSVAAGSAQSFQNPQAIRVDGPSSIASVADMNNDGLPDLIVQAGDTVTPSTITILLADAAGNYAKSSQISSSVFFPFPCVPADLNGDNKIDLVCASATPGGGVANVSVYLGNGDGTLQPSISTSLGYIGIPNALFDVIAVGDFNNDGHPDLILTSGPPGAYASYSFTLLGDGSGHFTVHPLAGTFYSGRATVADVNGDGKLDLLLPTGPTVLIGDGNGGFSTRLLYSSGNCIFADFEKTGKLSAGCGIQGGPLQFFRENADGSFDTGSPIASVSFSSSAEFLRPLEAIDLNGDGILDIALSSADGLQVMLGKSGLTFGAPTPYAAGSTESLYAVSGFFTDMDGDGHSDFVSTGPNTVYVSHGAATGSFDAAVLTESGASIYTARAADFDGDGFTDVVTIGPPGLNFLHGKGDGTFASPVAVALPAGYTNTSNASSSNDLLLGDFNGDGKKDLLIPIGIFSDSLMFLGKGDGTFASGIVIPAQTLPDTSLSNGGAVVFDINRDGKDDIMQVGKTSIDAYLSQGDGTFRVVSTIFTNSGNQNPKGAFTDLNGDGIVDAAVFFGDHTLIFIGNGDGTFTSTAANPSMNIPAIDGVSLITNVPSVIAVGDVDGDGKQDVALVGSYVNTTPDLYLGGTTVRYSQAIWVYYGNGDGTFSGPVSAGIFYDTLSLSIVAAPFQSGGPSELIALSNSGGGAFADPIASMVALIPSNAGRTFGTPRYFLGGEAIDSIQLIDFNHDGKPDLFASNGSWFLTTSEGSNSFAVLLNRPDVVKGTLTSSPQPSLAGTPYTVTATLVPFRSQLQTISGNVSFTVDGTSIAPASIANNTATQTISTSLTGGDHQITATWAGDENLAPVTVSAVQHIMDYTLAADASVSIKTGHQGSIGIHIGSINGFADTIALSCGNLPAYATCTFTNAAPSISSGQTIDAQITIGTAANTTAQNRMSAGYLPMSLAFVLPGLVLVIRRRKCVGLLLVVACLALTTAQGCGGGGHSGSGGGGSGGQTQPSTSPGTYIINITGNSKSSQLQHTASVSLTVTP
jgi:hypothetical protein